MEHLSGHLIKLGSFEIARPTQDERIIFLVLLLVLVFYIILKRLLPKGSK